MKSEVLTVMDVPLTKGLIAKVSLSDFERVCQYKWQAVLCSGKHYARKQDGAGRTTYLHRFILGLVAGSAGVVDHIDGDPLNNVRDNLRAVTQGVNLQNRAPKANGSSAYLGVFKQENGWIARIRFNKQGRYLGYFSSPEAAARAYDSAAVYLIGAGARLNFGVSPCA